MTDELTPEERDALKNLPRERMPSAGLEDRVVGAMRERGILATKRPGRVVRITGGRVAGLMAACVALMIGAYSIGLHRAGDNEVIRSVKAPVRDDASIEIQGLPRSEPASDASARIGEKEAPATQTTLAQPPAEARKQARAAQEELSLEGKVEDTDERADARASMPEQGLSAGRAEDTAIGAAPGSAPRENQLPAPSAAKMFAQELAAPTSPRERAFRLGGTAFIVDAPDSVRIVEDAGGRMLLIYTSDGLIRIRLAD